MTVYTRGVGDHFGNKQVVADKFHVIQPALEVCEQNRKIEYMADAGKPNRLKQMGSMWLKNRFN